MAAWRYKISLLVSKKYFIIKNHFHINGFVLSLASLWKWDFLELGNGLFPLSAFVFIYSLAVTRLAIRFSAKITASCIRGCHTCCLSYFTLVCLWCGRTVADGRCTVTWLPNFLGWVDLLTHGAPLASASRSREKSATNFSPLTNTDLFWKILNKHCALSSVLPRANRWKADDSF